MTTFFHALRRACLVLLLATSPVAAANAQAHPMPDRAALVESLLPAVVNIFIRKPPDPTPLTAGSATASGSNASDSETWKRYYGSGFIIDPSGIILTNRHVIDGARDIIVAFNDGRKAIGKTLAIDGGIDLALVKITADKPLPVLTFGDSDKLHVGDQVLAIGNPLGIGISVSSGIVSALNRNIDDTPYDDFIQTDAAINHGNSGGPLVDSDGHVIGIDTALYSDINNGGSIGLGFAITSNDARFVVQRLLTDGRVRAGWLGVKLQDVNPVIAEALNLPDARGSIVDQVESGTPAEKIGLREGDILLKVDDQTPSDARAFLRAVGRLGMGTAVKLTIQRDGRQSVIPVTLAEYPGDAIAAQPTMVMTETDRGLQLSDITAPLASKYSLPDGQPGVVVTGVNPEIITGERSLMPGDVILRVGEDPSTSPAHVWDTISQAQAQHRRLILMLVRTRDGQRWMPLLLSSLH